MPGTSVPGACTFHRGTLKFLSTLIEVLLWLSAIYRAQLSFPFRLHCSPALLPRKARVPGNSPPSTNSARVRRMVSPFAVQADSSLRLLSSRW